MSIAFTFTFIVTKSRGCRCQPSNRKCSDKSKKVSINSTPTLDTQTVPIAVKKNGSHQPVLSNFVIEQMQ